MFVRNEHYMYHFRSMVQYAVGVSSRVLVGEKKNISWARGDVTEHTACGSCGFVEILIVNKLRERQIATSYRLTPKLIPARYRMHKRELQGLGLRK